jgi:hypothetical protein
MTLNSRVSCVTDQPSAAWVPVEGTGPPAEQLDLADLAVLGEMTHPVRSGILRRLKEPRTVAEIAHLLDVPVTRLYHHVNHLESLGLIRVVATRRVAAVTERRYQVVARNFSVSSELFDSEDPHDVALALGSLFDLARQRLQREVENGGFSGVEDPGEHSMLSLGELHLSAERRGALVRSLVALVEEYRSDLDDADPDAVRMTLFVAAFPDST